MEQTIIHWITLHGYGVIFILLALGIFGLPLPNDLILASVGYLIFKGRLHPAPAVAVAFLGSLCGMAVNYAIGRTFGLYVVHKFGRLLHMATEQINRMHEWFEHSGKWALVYGYFLPGVRHLTALVAGTSNMTLREFLVFSSLGGFFWSITYILLGYFLEDSWSRETARIHHVLEIGTLIAVALAGIYFVQQRIGKRSRER